VTDRDPLRDSLALALAYLDDDQELAAEILREYRLDRETLDLLVGVLSLVALDRDEDEVAEMLYQLALIGAGREPS
jgi:hypothetical protein